MHYIIVDHFIQLNFRLHHPQRFPSRDSFHSRLPLGKRRVVASIRASTSSSVVYWRVAIPSSRSSERLSATCGGGRAPPFSANSSEKRRSDAGFMQHIIEFCRHYDQRRRRRPFLSDAGGQWPGLCGARSALHRLHLSTLQKEAKSCLSPQATTLCIALN